MNIVFLFCSLKGNLTTHSITFLPMVILQETCINWQALHVEHFLLESDVINTTGFSDF